MGNRTLVYKQKVQNNLKESFIHLKRLETASDELAKKYHIPLDGYSYNLIINDIQDLTFSDQIIYRFAKLQDSIGAKLFKSLLLYQGENVDKPFLNILNQLEKMDIVDVDEWFEIRNLRNEISHDYDNSNDVAINILNMIFELKNELKKILNSIDKIVVDTGIEDE